MVAFGQFQHGVPGLVAVNGGTYHEGGALCLVQCIANEAQCVGIRAGFAAHHAGQQRLARALPPDSEIVLLGSIATAKYVDVLLEHFGQRLRFPVDFVGRGDMSRGGLLLRCAVDRSELAYISVAGAVRKGKRPPKLEPRRYDK